jgi:magnesium-transporting ATPase (P-type)
MLRVYDFMAGGLGLTGIVAYAAVATGFCQQIAGTPLIWLVMLAPLGLVLLRGFGIQRMSAGAAQAAFWSYAALMGLSLAGIFLVFTSASIARVFFISAATFAAMSLYGYATRRDLSQFGSFLVMGLIGILLASIGHPIDGAVILGVVVINAAIGFVQEGRAEKALDAIRGMLTRETSVWRDGHRLTVAAKTLVVGDVVLTEAGDRIPADLRLLRASGLRIEEAVLTGESASADKSTEPAAFDAALGDRASMAYSGTLVAGGQGAGLVVATGAGTELGRISAMVGAVQPLTTPLLRQMDALATRLTIVILVVAAAVFAFAVAMRGFEIERAFMAAVGMAVAAIPEGLPAVMTITLAIGVRRMAEHKAIIRRLPAVETLGAVSTICSDKTGTLTVNEMTVGAIITPTGAYETTGAGYDPRGRASSRRKKD